MRLLTSLLACFHHRLRCRVVSYSIPDDTMLMTGSCGIRLVRPSCLLGAVVSVMRAMWAVVVPPLVPSGGSSLVPACLMFAAVCLDAIAPSSHRFISSLVLCCVPFSSACLGSCLYSLRLAPSSRRSYRPIASRLPPRLIDTTGGETRRRWVGVFLALLASFGSPSHPCGSASDGDGARVLASLHVHHRCRLLTARSPNQISSPSCRPIISSPSLPDHSTRGTGRGFLGLDCLLACSFVIAVRFALRAICVGSVEDGVGGCLACLAVVLCMLSMG